MRKFLLLLAVLSLLAACTMGSSSRSSPSDQPALGDVPASFYDYGPAMRDWYTGPHWPDPGP